ncbi:hypothetical protein L6164_016781 [Bauhinia variegata]|uniref:Uncharacterized protein n=1 Tax=Bauhinia variegata TaxID=167791 RepID=A0ACB9N5K2_BAUVA|nr:hypothetical protein L6164_016781 [Bauhinia variegata]
MDGAYVAEKEKCFNIFKENLEYIENFNDAENYSFKLGLNYFADLTTEEFIALADVPESLDWREKGTVTTIKKQSHCGSCWAFSAIAAVEGIVRIKTGKLISSSEQQQIDCSKHGNLGCKGCWMDKAFKYIIKDKGRACENNYTYKARDGNSGNAAIAVAQIIGYKDENVIPHSTMVSLLLDMEKTEDGTKYWLVKNSWGESGYMKLQRDTGKPHGLCGLAKKSYPTV